MPTRSNAILAAGAVLWRPSRKHGIKIAVIHRPRKDDWSLPKGKAEGRESPPMTAVREVAEETGFASLLGRAITVVKYQTPVGPKTVHYFLARCLDGRFEPNREVDEMVWLPWDRARERLTYPRDHTVLDCLLTLPTDLSTVLLVRHARAGQRGDFAGDDADRPLDTKGRRQAAALVGQLAAFRPSEVVSAPLQRCRQTVAPLAESMGMTVGSEPAFSEASYAEDPDTARRRLQEFAAGDPLAGPVVVCSQGGVIPGVLTDLASRARTTIEYPATPKGAYWLLSFEGKRLRQADRYLVSDR